MPRLSVLLPVRDAGPYLDASLASLARQSFREFEVVAVDDGSTDGSGERLERAAARDARIRVIHTAAHGLPAALNTALGAARGTLVARHDGDDLSHRLRFEHQLRFLDAHPEIAVAGTRVRLFPDRAFAAGMRRWGAWHNRLLDHDAIANEMRIDSPLAHGTSMIRRDWIESAGGWTRRDWPEDLDLWLRLLARGARFAKLPRTLYAWRQHATSATRRDPRYSRERFDALRLHDLRGGLLQGAPRVTLVGVGTSLARWRRHLEPVAAVTAIEAARPSAALVDGEPPLVLVFGAEAARRRWRLALTDRGLRERAEFIFVA